jgi:hypothetical protein
VHRVGRVNRVFEQTGVSYGPRAELGSEASNVAAKRRRDDAGVGLAKKCAKVSGQKVVAPNALVVAKGAGATSSKKALSKTTPSKAALSSTIPTKTSTALKMACL